MKQMAKVFGLGVLGALSLAGCGGLVGGAIPPVTVDNIAGLNGLEIEGDDLLDEAAVGAAVRLSKTFNNIDAAQFQNALNIKPNTISLALTFRRVTRRGTCTAPASLALEVRNLRVRLSETGSEANATFGTFTLNLTQAQDGSYNVAGVTGGNADGSVNIAIDNGLLAFGIVTAGAEPNTATASGRLRTADNSLRGCRLGLVIDSARATFSNFR